MTSHVKPLGELAPDYALLVAFPQEEGTATLQAQENVSKLVKQLEKHGFYTQARPADKNQIIVFVKVSDTLLLKYLKGEGVKEYLYGLRGELDTDESLIQQLTHTTKLNAVHHLLTDPLHEGGAGITPGSPEWAFVTKIAPIWDYDENKRLLKSFLKPNFTDDDVEKIRSVAGEKVAMYFAFADFYFKALIAPAVLGLLSHVIFKRYSLLYTVLNSIWAMVFLAAWRKKQTVLALKWNTAGSSKVEIRRTDFQGETLDTDPVTGESIPSFSPMKRTAREIAFLPIALGGIALLVSYQVTCFFIEIFLTEIYQGPGKAFLGLVPTILIVGVVPILTSFYEKFVNKALAFENHEFQSTYDRSKTQKMYVYNFLSSYVPLFITVFFYLPFGHNLNHFVPTINAYSSKLKIPVLHEKYQINNDRLIGQFGYFTLTAQIIGFVVENVVPIVLRFIREKRGDSNAIAKHLDSPQETAFLNNVRQQLSMPEFDVDGEYRELVMQFGYLVLFGPVWSLAPLVSLIFNWIEVRGDAEKLLFECSRPVPRQAENMCPWDTHIRILTWIGSFTGPLVAVMYRRHSEVLASSTYSHFSSPIVTPGWKLATTALIAENVALGFNFAAESLFQSSTSQVEKEHNKKGLLLRRSYVEAYANDASIDKRSVEIDPTATAWKSFSSDNVVKAAIGFPALLAAAKAASDKIKGTEKATATKATSENVDAAADSVPSSSTGYAQHSSDAELRSTTASKTVPKTSDPSGTKTREPVLTDDTPINNTANPYNAAPSASAPSHTKEAVVGGGIAAGLASAVGINASEIQNDNVSTVPSDETGLGIPVTSTADASAQETTTPKKKRGFFGLGKKDAKSVGKAVKTDATKVAPQLKAVGAGVAHGDFDSAKKAAKDFSKNPDEFVGNTKAALASAKTSGSAAPTSQDSSIDATGPTSSKEESKSAGLGSAAGVGAAIGAGAAAAGLSKESTPSSTSESASRSKSLFKMGKPKRDSKIIDSSAVPASDVPVTQSSAPSSSAAADSIGSGAAAPGAQYGEDAPASGLSGSLGTAAVGVAATLGAAGAAIGLKHATASAPAPEPHNTGTLGATVATVAALGTAGAAVAGISNSKSTDADASAPTDSVPVASESPSNSGVSTPSKSKGFFGSLSSFGKSGKTDVKKDADDFVGNAKEQTQEYKSTDPSVTVVAPPSVPGTTADIKTEGTDGYRSTDPSVTVVSPPSTTSEPSSTGMGSIGTAAAGLAATVGVGAAALGMSKDATPAPAPASSSGVSGSLGTVAAGVAATAVAGAAAVGYANSKGNTEAETVSSSSPSVPSEYVNVPSTAESTEEAAVSQADSTPSKSSKGFFGFHKKDISSLGKAAKADFTKLTPDAKKIAGDIKNGDWSSAKKFASDVKSNPDQYFGNTKGAVSEARRGEGEVSTHVPSTETGASTTATETSAPSSNGVTGSLGGLAAAVGLGSYVGSQAGNEHSATGTSDVNAPTSNETELKSSTPSESVAPSSTAEESGPGSAAPDSSNKNGSAGVATGLGLGAVAGALGLGSTDKGTSTPSSSSGSLAGATLPPDFEKKVSSRGNGMSPSPSAPGTPSGQQTGYTGSTAPAFGSQPDAAVSGSAHSNTVSTPQKQTLDPKISTPETSGSSNLKTGAVAGGAAATLAAAGSSLSNKFSANQGSQKISSNLAAEGDPSLMDNAKTYAGKGGKSLNDYVQLAADKVDDYAKKSDNQYLTQGNAYVQKLADGVEDYTQKHSNGAAPSTPKQGSQFVKTETPEQKSTGATGALPAQFLENTNPFTGDTGVVTAQGEVLNESLAPPKIATDSHSVTSSNVSSPSKKKKKGLLSKIKEKVSSPSSTPKKQ